MRSVILSLAVLATSVLAAPARKCATKVHANTMVEYVDITVTQTVYVTEGATPTPKPEPVTTIVYVAPPPPPPPSPSPVYHQPVYNAPSPSPSPKPVSQPAPQPVAPAPQGDDQKCLEAHNTFRAAHGAPALTWNQELANWARDHTGDCTMHHSGGPYGENLAFGYTDVVAAVTAWYNEKDQYNPSAPGFQMSTGHFTQLVWKATSELGCYNRQCGGSQYLMCEYRTAGNVVGDNGKYFTENVQM